MRISALFIIFGILMLFGGTLYMEFADKDEIKIKCYDRYSNEIEGLVCYNDTYSNEADKFIVLFLLLGGLILAACAFLWWWGEEFEQVVNKW